MVVLTFNKNEKRTISQVILIKFVYFYKGNQMLIVELLKIKL